MKKLIFTFASWILLLTITATHLLAQEAKKGKKYRIKIEKIEDGKTMKLDTVLRSDKPFVWQGDTIRPGDTGETAQHFSFDFDDDGSAHVIILKQNMARLDSMQGALGSLDTMIEKNMTIIRTMDDDDIFNWHGDGEHYWHSGKDFHFPPNGSGKAYFFEEKKEDKNVVDLSDPDIISYKKKTLKDGTEKITIVRKKKPENAKPAKVIIKSGSGHASADIPGEEEIVVVDESGKVIVNGEVLEVGVENGVKVIKKGDKICRIKESNKGKVKQIEVEVEKETEGH